MSVYRSIVISLINSAEYKVIPDAEKAARYNTNSPEYYVLMDSEGNKVENISEVERYLMNNTSSAWHTIVAPRRIGHSERVRINPQHIVSIMMI